MKRSVLIVFLAGTTLLRAQDAIEKQPAFEFTEDSVLKVDHKDSVPSVIKRKKTAKKKKDVPTTGGIGRSVLKGDRSVALICYKNGVCQVKDTRTVVISPGINEAVVDGLYPGLAEESLSFRTPKNGKICVISYRFCKKDLSPKNLLLSSVGEEVFFRPGGSDRQEKGKLLSVEENDTVAVIESNQKCFPVPIDRCTALGMKALEGNCTNSLHLLFESPNAGDTDIEINYLTKNISWKHVCIVDVFEKLDRVDISSEALLRNDTDFDLENLTVTFDSFSPSFSDVDCRNDKLEFPKNSDAADYVRNVSVKKRSRVMCMLKSVKDQKPQLKYLVKIPTRFPAGDFIKEIPVVNLLVIENAAKLGIDLDIQNSELFIFRRANNEPNFWGRRGLSSFVKNGNFVLEIGATNDLSARAQRTDFRKISDGQREYGVKINIKNNRCVESEVTLITDTNSTCKIIKKDFEFSDQSDSSSRKLQLKPNESKELHFRIRMDERNGTENLS